MEKGITNEFGKTQEHLSRWLTQDTTVSYSVRNLDSMILFSRTKMKFSFSVVAQCSRLVGWREWKMLAVVLLLCSYFFLNNLIQISWPGKQCSSLTCIFHTDIILQLLHNENSRILKPKNYMLSVRQTRILYVKYITRTVQEKKKEKRDQIWITE